MLYLGMGTLPWMNIGVKHSIEDRYGTILLAKQQLFAEKRDVNRKDSRFSQF